MPHLNREFNKTLSEVPIDKLRLLEDRILCRVVKKPRRKGRFFLEHYEYNIKTSVGRVLKTGIGYTGSLQPGTYIIYETWQGREFQSPDETLIILRPDHILAVIEKESK